MLELDTGAAEWAKAALLLRRTSMAVFFGATIRVGGELRVDPVEDVGAARAVLHLSNAVLRCGEAKAGKVACELRAESGESAAILCLLSNATTNTSRQAHLGVCFGGPAPITFSVGGEAGGGGGGEVHLSGFWSNLEVRASAAPDAAAADTSAAKSGGWAASLDGSDRDEGAGLHAPWDDEDEGVAVATPSSSHGGSKKRRDEGSASAESDGSAARRKKQKKNKKNKKKGAVNGAGHGGYM